MTKAQTSTSTRGTAEQQAAAKAAQFANSDAFYRAKDELFFCHQVVGMAACASAMSRSLRELENAGRINPEEMKRMRRMTDGVDDWHEMPSECIHWSLTLAVQRMNDAADRMESAFMAAERAAEA